MSDTTVTRNDLKNILNEVLPPTPSEYKKLLWTNSSSGSFVAQTISLSLSDYDHIEIWFYTPSYTDPVISNVLTLEVGQRNRVTLIHSLGSDGVNENTGSRLVEVNANGVVFTDYTYKNRRSGGALTTANQFGVPYKIYGVKYERVYPPQAEAADYVVEQGTSGIWTYRKWSSGVAECWGHTDVASTAYSANGGYKAVSASLPSGLFIAAPDIVNASGRITGNIQTMMGFTSPDNASSIQTYLINRSGSAVTQAGVVYWNVKGKWK